MDRLTGADRMFSATAAAGLRNIARKDIDLTDGLTDRVLNMPGTLVYLDRRSTGYVFLELNAGQAGVLDDVAMVAGDSIECPFSTLKLNAPAQPGKTLSLRICNGVSIRGGSGLSTGGSTTVSANVLVANTTDDRIPVDVAGGDIYVTATNVGVQSPDTLATAADVAINAGGRTAVVAAAGGGIQEREVTVKNLTANTAPLRIGDVGCTATRGHELMPGESITLNTLAAIYAWNTGAADQSVSVVVNSRA